MERIIVIRYSEIALKGKNRFRFEDRLVLNLKNALKGTGLSVKKAYGRIIVRGDIEDGKSVREKLKKTFGIENFSFGIVVKSDFETMKSAAVELLGEATQDWETFRVSTVRQDKTFPYGSMEVSRDVGASCLEKFAGNGKHVKMVGADIEVLLEIAHKDTFITAEKIKGPGGLPVGITGKVMCMLSGGIDSPVAAWYMMKRGCEVEYVHFHSMPYTDRASVDKVHELSELLKDWQGSANVIDVPFLDIQKKIMEETDAKYRILMYRRFMVRIAEAMARKRKCRALVTGESLAQVASQTLENIAVVEDVATMPILRPLIGMDKSEIMDRAQMIGTFETSIIPHGDCCSLFTPRNPATRARIGDVREDESSLDVQKIVDEALKGLK